MTNAIQKAHLLQENERYQGDIELKLQAARDVQQGLLPQSPVSWQGFEVGGVSLPADETGGDYFDFFPMLDGALGIVVGDVSGHGFGPAILAAALHSYMRALAQTESDTSKIVSVANSLFLDRSKEQDRFATLMLVRLHFSTRSLVYTSAGHEPGFVLTPSGELRVSLESTDLPIGIDVDNRFSASPFISIRTGETLVVFTDGVKDARAEVGDQFGIQRILDTARLNLQRPAQEIARNLCAIARDFQFGRQQDDITAVVVKSAL